MEEEKKKYASAVPKIQIGNLPDNNFDTVVSYLETITRSHAYKFQRKSNSSEEQDGNSDVFQDILENETEYIESKTSSSVKIEELSEENPKEVTKQPEEPEKVLLPAEEDGFKEPVTPKEGKFNVSIVKEINLSVNDTPM